MTSSAVAKIAIASASIAMAKIAADPRKVVCPIHHGVAARLRSSTSEDRWFYCRCGCDP